MNAPARVLTNEGSLSQLQDTAVIDAGSTVIATRPATALTLDSQNEWTRERVELLKRTFAAGATDDEFALFLGTCKRLRLSPEARQIFSVKRWDSDLGGYVRQTQVSIDGLRLVAERTGQYRGQTPIEWCGKDGVWRDIWLEDTPPFAARVGVMREGYAAPLYRTAKWSAFVQTVKNGAPNKMWREKGDHMLGKCAEANALRAAFPNECAGVYTTDEMGQANNGEPEPNEIRATVVESKPAPERPDTRPARKVESYDPVVVDTQSRDVPRVEVPRLVGKAYKDKVVLIDALDNEAVINYVRSLMHAKEADAAKKGEWQQYWTKQIAKAVDWAQLVRGITDFSVSKAERAKQLKAAVDDRNAFSDEMYLCENHGMYGDDTGLDLDIRKWTNAEKLVEYINWLRGTYNQPTQTARITCAEQCLAKLIEAEAEAAERALSKKAASQ